MFPSGLPMRPDAPAVVLTHAAGEVRRRLPAPAWVALECMATAAVDRGGEVTTTVRELGERVGLNKDTVARALQALIDAGLVARHDLRDGESGRFGSSCYRVELTAAGFASPRPNLSDAAAVASAPTAQAERSPANDPTTDPDRDNRSKNRTDVNAHQLTLIDP
jgi:hypothetical protein